MSYQTSRKTNLNFAADKVVNQKAWTRRAQKLQSPANPCGVCRGKGEHDDQRGGQRENGIKGLVTSNNTDQHA